MRSLRAPIPCALFCQQETTALLCSSEVDCVAGFLQAQRVAAAGTLCSVAVITGRETPSALLGEETGAENTNLKLHVLLFFPQE